LHLPSVKRLRFRIQIFVYGATKTWGPSPPSYRGAFLAARGSAGCCLAAMLRLPCAFLAACCVALLAVVWQRLSLSGALGAGIAAPSSAEPVQAVFIVSVTTNKKRRRALSRRLRMHGLESIVTWIDAFDVTALTPPQIAAAYRQHRYHTDGPWASKRYSTTQPLTLPEISATMKHVEALRLAARLPPGARALVLEDDAVFKPGWGRGGAEGAAAAAMRQRRRDLQNMPFKEQLRRCVASLPPTNGGWDVLFIGEGQLQQDMHINATQLAQEASAPPKALGVHRKRWHADWAPYPWPMLLSKWNVARSPEAYIVHAASAAALVGAMTPFAFPIDAQLAFTLNAMTTAPTPESESESEESKVFWSEPSLVTQLSENQKWSAMSSGIKQHAK
jgi:hypothetical protein